jgi:multidrug efflux pump subunit AcrA (membrane-fusion protein)
MISAWGWSMFLALPLATLMKPSVAATAIVAGISLLTLQCEQPIAAEADSLSSATVTVARATKACFTGLVRVNGYLVPRVEAIVTLDPDGSSITEVLAGEGDNVRAGQALARFTRPSTEGGSAQPAGRPLSGTLTAPFAGVVTRSVARVGAAASPQSEPLFRIMKDNVIELDAEVSSIHVATLSPGQTARIVTENGQELSGRVRSVSAEIDPRTQYGHVRLSIDSDSSVRIGVFARATINASVSCGVSLPRSAVSYGTENTVQLVDKDTVKTRQVRIGLLSDTSVEILSGVSEGETVVANAGSSLHDGDRVSPKRVEDVDQTGAQ